MDIEFYTNQKLIRYADEVASLFDVTKPHKKILSEYIYQSMCEVFHLGIGYPDVLHAKKLQEADDARRDVIAEGAAR